MTAQPITKGFTKIHKVFPVPADEGSEQRGSYARWLGTGNAQRSSIPVRRPMRELIRSLQPEKEKPHGIGCPE
jgi:hypothetical protein